MADVRARLLEWYDAHARDLPWRRTRDPYAIWVSEVMLQQTRVETVIPYYERFLDRYPTPAALAGADEDDVMSCWSGLGYYRRARMLRRGAREVVAAYGGRVPAAPEARRALPGVGDYTAGAIGSIAFDREEPAVDGNVMRVLARIHAIDTPLGRVETDARIRGEADRLVRGPRPGALNQALMELGATVCARTPRCDACPVSTECLAHASGRERELPVPRRKKPPQKVQLVAAVLTLDQRVVLVRAKEGLFTGLFAPPMCEGTTRARMAAELGRMGIEAVLRRSATARVTHVLSHRVFEVRVFRGKASRIEASDDLRALARDALATVGVSRLTGKLLDAC